MMMMITNIINNYVTEDLLVDETSYTTTMVFDIDSCMSTYCDKHQEKSAVIEFRKKGRISYLRGCGEVSLKSEEEARTPVMRTVAMLSETHGLLRFGFASVQTADSCFGADIKQTARCPGLSF